MKGIRYYGKRIHNRHQNNDKYIVVYKGDKEFCKMGKSANKLEDVVRFIGFMNVKEVIK